MIARDQILPSLFHLQRHGHISAIEVCARNPASLRRLASDPTLTRAFPGHTFVHRHEPFREVIASLPPEQLVVVALPDQLHFDAVMAALEREQHVLCMKPLVHFVAELAAIRREAYSRGLLVGIDYHKRFDDRSLMARQRYREGAFGEFRLGTACLLEKWHYRDSNFQNWFTCDATDAFTYIGCHYVDLVAFITGLLPAEVSLRGVKDRFPNGEEGWLWTDARVVWSNDAILNVQNALGFPDAAPGSNTQGLTMYCSGGAGGAWLHHSDQYRGLAYCELPGAYSEPSPDYFQLVDQGGVGRVPVGYGYRSVEFVVRRALELRGWPLAERRALLNQWDRAGMMATPANSGYNEAVIEAARVSLHSGGHPVSCIRTEG